MAQPPMQTWQPPEPAPPSAGSLPGSVTAAAVMLFVGAALAGLFAAFAILGSLMFAEMPSSTWTSYGGYDDEQMQAIMRSAVVGVVAFAVIFLVVAAVHVVAGVGVLRRRGWARILGLVISIIALLLILISIAGLALALGQPYAMPSTLPPGYDEESYRALMRTTVTFSRGLVAIPALIYAYMLIMLIRRGDVFR